VKTPRSGVTGPGVKTVGSDLGHIAPGPEVKNALQPFPGQVITHSHGSASVVRATIKVNGEGQTLTPRHP